MIKENQKITIPEMANELGVSTRAVEKQLAALKKAGKVSRFGSEKGGYWVVMPI